jgi:heat-inducible transcriptional repressor
LQVHGEQNKPDSGRRSEFLALIAVLHACYIESQLEPLNRRARDVLYALLTEFISNGEPVGSRTLVRKYRFNLSPATIRNVLADLEHLGYLIQPHTSAGRVPTEKAFRLFIDALMKTRQLSAPDAAKIAEWLRQQPTGNDLLRSTGRLLSELTGSPAVVVRRSPESRPLLKIRFIPTRPSELLTVVVFRDGTVENRFVHLDTPLDSGELDRVHQMLEEVAEGRTLAELREHFVHARDSSQDELQPLNERGLTLVNAAIDRTSHTSELVVEGQARLLDRADLSQSEQLKEYLRALEDRNRLILLLDRTLESKQVQVFLGDDVSGEADLPMSLVAAPYRNQTGEPEGAVGVIGPTRMDYSVVVPLVGATADAVARALARADQCSSSGTTDVEPQGAPAASGLSRARTRT